MSKITLTLQAVTPLFMSGAVSTACEFRASGIKGSLRYWFRALYPHLLSEESSLFGSTELKSPLRIRTRDINPRTIPTGDSRFHNAKLSYLGYGIIAWDREQKKNVTTKAFFDVASMFDLELMFSSKLNTEAQHRILSSLWCLFMFGGLGARTRRGFGSLRICDIHDSDRILDDFPTFSFKNRTEWIQTIEKFLKRFCPNNDQTSHTAFSKDMRLIILPDQASSMVILNKIGENFQNFRSYRQGRQYPEDHDLIYNYLKYNKEPYRLPERSAFGLPHNYFFSSLDGKYVPNKCDVYNKDGGQPGRRSSPLFIHVQGFTNGMAGGAFLFLPAPFLKDKKKVTIVKKYDRFYRGPRDYTGIQLSPLDCSNFYSGVEKYLDHLLKTGGEEIT